MFSVLDGQILLPDSVKNEFEVVPGKHGVNYVHPTAFVGEGTELLGDVYIWPHAYVGKNCKIDHSVNIHSYSNIRASAVIKSGVTICARATIGSGAIVGDFSHIGTRSFVGPDTRVGRCSTLHNGASIRGGCALLPHSTIAPRNRIETSAPDQFLLTRAFCLDEADAFTFSMTARSDFLVNIGCLEHNIDYWLANYEMLGEEHELGPHEVVEYGILLRAAREWIALSSKLAISMLYDPSYARDSAVEAARLKS